MKKTLKLNKGPYMKKFIITCIFLILQSENALAQDANQDTYNNCRIAIAKGVNSKPYNFTTGLATGKCFGYVEGAKNMYAIIASVKSRKCAKSFYQTTVLEVSKRFIKNMNSALSDNIKFKALGKYPYMNMFLANMELYCHPNN